MSRKANTIAWIADAETTARGPVRLSKIMTMPITTSTSGAGRTRAT